MKKITAYVWSFILLLIAFFSVGMFTLGSTVTAGDSLTFIQGKAVYYQMQSTSLRAVYVNVGALHTEEETAMITARYSTSSSAISGISTFTGLGSATLGNSSEKGVISDGLYNWIAIPQNSIKASVKKLVISASVNLEINEVVALDTNGKLIELSYCPGGAYSKAEVEKTLDAQESFARFVDEEGNILPDNDAFSNFAPEEGHYMSAVQNVLSGNEKYDDSYYTLDGNFNYLATVLMVPSVALFGVSPFALRLPAFIATCLLILFAFLLIKELTKKDQCAFWFSVALMLGGMVTTVGRMGAPYAMVASALLASAYFMYRFFAYGISSKDLIRGSMNVLVSGLFASVAMAMDLTAVIPVAGILTLFGFGMRRQHLAYKLALSKVSAGDTESDQASAEVKAVKETFAMKNRIAYGLAALGFVMSTAILVLFATVVCYSAYVRAYNITEQNFIVILWKGLTGSLRDNGVTVYTAANTSHILAWLIPFKPATLYTGAASTAEGAYLGWHVLPNAAVLFASALAFLGATVKFILDFVQKRKDKKTLRIRRTYIVLVSGMLAAFLAAAIRGNFSLLTSLIFQVCYVGFLPLVLALLPEPENKKDKLLINLVCFVVVAMFAVVFALSIPAMYGITVMASNAKTFSWLSILSNGFFR